ncbi:hypothetical protein [Arthrobacter sp. NPDC090010]|uniref:hypothetical protein n=1 Tax=Arthrobacter sp. NPDC090010 TaxID=3363942 RepID=UPI00380F2171
MSFITTRTKTAGAVAAVAALALSLSACTITVDTKGGKPVADETSAPVTSQDASPSQDPSPSESASSTAASTADTSGGPSVADMTAAGTALKLGQPAKIFVQFGKPDKDYYDKQLFDVKVTDIEKGAFADLSALKGAEKYKGYTPYYIHSEVTLKQTMKPIKSSVSWSASGFKGNLKGGARAGSLIIFGGFDKCRSARSFKAIGDTQVDCQIALAPTGTEVAEVAYSGYSSNYASYDLNPYTDKPIVWTK